MSVLNVVPIRKDTAKAIKNLSALTMVVGMVLVEPALERFADPRVKAGVENNLRSRQVGRVVG
jgi:hypothetical protein